MVQPVELEVLVESVAVHRHDPERFTRAAAEVAARLPPTAVEMLATLYHEPSEPPPRKFDYDRCGLGGWLVAWQFAIFELFYHIGLPALPVLRRTAYGEYDWTQANAVEILVRLAAAGLEREEIVAEIRGEFPGFRMEAQWYVVGPLLRHAARDPAVAEIVRRLEDVDWWERAVQEVSRKPGTASPAENNRAPRKTWESRSARIIHRNRRLNFFQDPQAAFTFVRLRETLAEEGGDWVDEEEGQEKRLVARWENGLTLKFGIVHGESVSALARRLMYRSFYYRGTAVKSDAYVKIQFNDLGEEWDGWDTLHGVMSTLKRAVGGVEYGAGKFRGPDE